VPAQHPTSSYSGDGVGDGVGSLVGGVHSSSSPNGIHVHSAADEHGYSESNEAQKDHVIGELPVQHPGSVMTGAGGAVVTAGGRVGGEQSSGSSVTIHEHTPLYSQLIALSKSLQNAAVRDEYPAQHPTSSVGTGVGRGVGG